MPAIYNICLAEKYKLSQVIICFLLAEDDKSKGVTFKRPSMSLLSAYRQNWKARHNHFARYCDVKPKGMIFNVITVQFCKSWSMTCSNLNLIYFFFASVYKFIYS